MARVKKTSKNAKRKYFRRVQGRRKANYTITVATFPPLERQTQSERRWTTRALDVIADVLREYKKLEEEWDENMSLAAEYLKEI